ncbi:probable uridine nucleosidase 2 isoform X2 [Solenopsis invicta]|uniref:probable uridine nucleosidase 2 isoform X2 n=1 Tax=Solenopsis invicta TaxID=13686 RepID=UPI000595EAB2|nr:probable uridine nucleosidase 2 isoform X2 [Solenopsis invicta]
MAICTVFKIIIMLHLLCFAMRKNTRKIVIDTDPGGDDALALMLALKYEDVDIQGITVTYGNTNLENVKRNLLKILTIAERTIPVYVGSCKPLINDYKPDYYFGCDGFGDFNFTENITAKIDTSKPAAVFLVDLVKQNPGKITVITLGPLTTIATAIALEPKFLHLTKQHIIMGGSLDSNKIEFNFKQDPESNWIALNNTDKPSIIVPIDTVQSHAFSKDERKNLFNGLNKSIANFLHNAERKALEQSDMWQPADSIAVAIALHPKIIMRSFDTNLIPVLTGDARGSLVTDSNSQIHNARVIEYFDKARFKRLLLKYLSK